MSNTKQYFESKIEAVNFVLQNAEIADWYKTQHNLNCAVLDHQSVNTYGISGFGEISDDILNDGIINGVIGYDGHEGQYYK